MPIVIYIGNVKIRIYPKDHTPPHVHAIGPDSEVKFELATLACTFSRGFSLNDIKRIQNYLEGHQEYLMEVWNEYQED
jgi:hypothetical protein